jgi:hypothetical protein
MRYKLVSSVNSLISALISFTISFIKIINKRVPSMEIHNHLLDNNILTPCQSGFIKGDSAVNQLINITNDFGKVR